MPYRALSALLVWASCYDPSPKLGVPCSETGACPAGQECDPFTQVCMLPTGLVTWRDDTAADFGQPGAALTNGIIEAGGFVGPTPYLTGRARLSAIGSDTIGTVGTATWATTSAGTIAGRAFATGLSLDFSDRVPPGLGLATGDNVTVLIEGEIYFDATGVWRLRLQANDKGFFELAPPGGDYSRLVADVNTGTIVTHMVGEVGWHRFRAAFADSSQLMSFELELDSPVVAGMFRPIGVEQVRAPVDDLEGYLVDAFDHGALVDYIASTHDNQPLDRQIATDAFGIPIGMLGWSLRWSGQILIETEGDYSFGIVSFQGHRLWIDGMQVANNFATTATTTSTTAPIHLVPGWHDFVADVSKDDDATAGQMSVTVASGPEWAGQTVPIDHIRPVSGRAARWVADNTNAVVPIPDAGSTSRGLALTLPVGFVPELLEVGYEIDHPQRAQVSVVLNPPVGADITLLAAGSLTGAGTYNAHASVSLSQFGTGWTIIAADSTLDTIVGNIELAAVTAIGRGGVTPFPTSVRFESAVRELGDVVGFGPATWQLRQGSTATVQFRTCDDAACASELWTDAVHGAVPANTARRFAQYAVSLTTDGDVPTAFDWFELVYSARP